MARIDLTAGERLGMRTSHLPEHDDTWTPDDARRVLDEWQRTGTTVAEFARHRGLSAARLYWWRRRLNRPTSTALALVPAMVTARPLPLAGRTTEVTIRVGDIAVEIADATPAWVAGLVAELAGPRP